MENKKIEVWATGYADNSGSSGAIILHTAYCNTLDDAIKDFNSTRKDNELKATKVTQNGFATIEDYNNRDHNYRFWGCPLYDNEIDARKSFG